MSDAKQQLNEMRKFMRITEMPESLYDPNALTPCESCGKKITGEDPMDDEFSELCGDCVRAWEDRVDADLLKDVEGFEPGDETDYMIKSAAGDNYFEEDVMDERGKTCPVCLGGRRPGYGNDCRNCNGEGYVAEDYDEWDEDDDEHYNMDDAEVEKFEGRTVYVTDLYDGDVYGILDDCRFMLSGPLDRGYGVGNVTPDEVEVCDTDYSLSSKDKEFLRRWYLADVNESKEIKLESSVESALEVSKTALLRSAKLFQRVVDGLDREYEELTNFADPDDPISKAEDLQFAETAHEDSLDYEKIVNLLKKGKGRHAVKFYDNLDTISLEHVYTYLHSDEIEYLQRVFGKLGSSQLYYDNKYFEDVSLTRIAESVLAEYPGQPKDYEDDELGPMARGKSQITKNVAAEQGIDVTDLPMRDFEQDEIDPDYEDSELGLRFD